MSQVITDPITRKASNSKLGKLSAKSFGGRVLCLSLQYGLVLWLFRLYILACDTAALYEGNLDRWNKILPGYIHKILNINHGHWLTFCHRWHHPRTGKHPANQSHKNPLPCNSPMDWPLICIIIFNGSDRGIGIYYCKRNCWGYSHGHRFFNLWTIDAYIGNRNLPACCCRENRKTSWMGPAPVCLSYRIMAIPNGLRFLVAFI